MERERLGSRLGFILLSAGCAIGCGNVWKFPWMCGQYGGGGFVLIYILCLLLLGLPVMTMEFAVGRAAQASPIHMYQKLERKGQKWHLHGYVAFFGNIALMAFYTVVTGWIIYYFVRFLTGQTENLGFVTMITNPGVNVTYLAVTVIVAFGILCFNLQGGLERITKYMMTLLMVLMVVLAIHSATLSGAAEGLKFYLVPDFSKITGPVIVGAMNQAFFTLSVGMGSMAIFGSSLPLLIIFSISSYILSGIVHSNFLSRLFLFLASFKTSKSFLIYAPRPFFFPVKSTKTSPSLFLTIRRRSFFSSFSKVTEQVL